MSFQAYLDTIKKKTGKTPDDFRVLAEQKGFLNGDVKTGKILILFRLDPKKMRRSARPDIGGKD